MIDYLWIVAAIVLTITLAGKLLTDIWREHRKLVEQNRQKTFHLTMQLHDRMKLDLKR